MASSNFDVFQNSESDVEGFSSVKEKLIQTEDNTTQTSKVETTDCETQLEAASASSQTEIEQKIPEYDEKRLAIFLQKIYSGVMEQLDQIHHQDPLFKSYNLPSETGKKEIKELKKLEPDPESKLIVNNMCWNKTGTSLVIGFGHAAHDGGWCSHEAHVIIWDTRKTTKLDTSACVTAIACHPVSPFIVVAGLYSGDFIIWNLENVGDEVLARITGRHASKVCGIVWYYTPMSRPFILTAGGDGRLLTWKVEITTGKVALEDKFLVNPESVGVASNPQVFSQDCGMEITSLTINSKSQLILAIDGGRVAECSIRSTQPLIMGSDYKETVVFNFESHKSLVNTVQWHPEKPYFVSYSRDKEIRVYRPEKRLPLYSFVCDGSHLQVIWTHLDNIVACYGGVEIEFYDAYKKVKVEEFSLVAKLPILYSAMAISPSRDVVFAVGDTGGTVRTYSMPTVVLQD